MPDALVFAMLADDPDTVAVIERDGVCWPHKSLPRARKLAKQVGAPGLWRIKPRANV